MNRKPLSSRRQPLNSFFQPNVLPGAKSQISLSGGPNEPYYYSLGVGSTVPFVELIGSGGTPKIISWGEMIEVMPNENVVVKNASYMVGDIQINSGHDFAAKPERISTPIEVDITIVTPGVLSTITPKFPCDTRRCRKAYLSFLMTTGAIDSAVLVIIGKNQQHSFINSIIPKQYVEGVIVPPLSQLTVAGLGFGSNTSDLNLPMTLCDYATFTFSYNPVEASFYIPATPLFFYTMEY